MRPQERFRSFRLVGLALGSALGTILAVDLVLLALSGPVRMVEDFYESNLDYGYRMRPQLEFVFASPFHGYQATVRTNLQGLRDDEIQVPKPLGRYRILLLGDSITAGLEVDKNSTFEAVCEKTLREYGDVEVINAGVRGYNIDNVLGFLQTEGLRYQADLVVYLFVENDLMRTAEFSPKAFDPSPGFSIQGVMGKISVYSHLLFRFEILRQTIAMRRDSQETPTDKIDLPAGLYNLLRSQDFQEPTFELTAQRIGHIAELSKQSGADFVLMGTAMRVETSQVTQAWWRRYLGQPGRPFNFDGGRDYLDRVASKYSLLRLDPVPVFRQNLDEKNDFWFYKDDHLNTRGHQLMGELLVQRIESIPSFQTWQRRTH